MRLYLDTSLLVAALTDEADTAHVQAWLDKQDPGVLVISDWVMAEFSAALSVKLRSRSITAAHRATALAKFAALTAESFGVLPVSSLQFRNAARFADQFQLGLRAGDALHLAVCADHGATLCTLDRRLGKAGPSLGVKTILL